MEKLPWFSPDESVEAVELLEKIAATLKQMAEYVPVRREIRSQWRTVAQECEIVSGRSGFPYVERSVLMALEAIAEKRKVRMNELLQEAIEDYVSKIARGK